MKYRVEYHSHMHDSILVVIAPGRRFSKHVKHSKDSRISRMHLHFGNSLELVTSPRATRHSTRSRKSKSTFLLPFLSLSLTLPIYPQDCRDSYPGIVPIFLWLRSQSEYKRSEERKMWTNIRNVSPLSYLSCSDPQGIFIQKKTQPSTNTNGKRGKSTN